MTSLAALVLAKPTPMLFWIGLPLVVLGQCIRMWSAGYLRKMDELATGGPYAMCRNPLYVGSFLMSAGFFIMCNRLYVLVGGVAIFCLFHWGAVAYEEGILRQKFGQPYVEYCKVVSRFFPRLCLRFERGQFSAALACKNNECGRSVGVALLSLLFGLMAYLPSIAPLEFIAEHLQ